LNLPHCVWNQAVDLQLEIRAGTHFRAAGYLGGLPNARPDIIHLAVCNWGIRQNWRNLIISRSFDNGIQKAITFAEGESGD
jgi:hypothetical protein